MFIVCKWAAKLRQNLIFLEQPQSGLLITGNPGTGPLKPKVASKNPWMGDYIQKRDLDEGFNLVHVTTIVIGENINKMDLLVTKEMVQNIGHFRYFVFLSCTC